MISLDFGSTQILKRLSNAGYEAYIVGGSVRDSLLNKSVSDYDITTSACPDFVCNLFSEYNVIKTGIKHGTVTVVIDKKPYEITTFRTETGYSDFRRPDKVEFSTSLLEDLKRRDFTINSMCYSTKTGLIDNFNGLEDLKNGIIRTVGDPNERFNEDALRILRAVRFSAQLGFAIEKETEKALYKNKTLLNEISSERVFSELCKIITAKNRCFALKNYSEIIFEIIPELKPCYKFEQLSLSHNADVYQHTLNALSIDESFDLTVGLALLLHDSGKPQSFHLGKDGFGHYPDHNVYSKINAEKVFNRLKVPNKLKNDALELVFLHDEVFSNDEYTVKSLLNKYGKEFVEKLMLIKKADLFAHSEHGINKYGHQYYGLIDIFNKIISSGDCYTLSDLKFNGENALSLGYSGKDTGDLLQFLLNAVMQNKVENDTLKLREFAKNNYHKNI